MDNYQNSKIISFQFALVSLSGHDMMTSSALSDHLCEDYLVFSVLGQISQNIKYEILTVFCVLYQVP